MMYLILSNDVRRAILHGRKKSRRKNQTRMRLRQRKSDDSLMTNSTAQDPMTSTMEPRQLPPLRNEHSLGSTSTALSQHNTHSIGTTCTDLACDPIREEAYGPYRRRDNGFSDPVTDSQRLGFDQGMLPWGSLGMIRAGPESMGNRSPYMVRRDRKESSPVKRNGNIVLNHKIVRDPEEGRSTEEESQDKKRRRKRHVSSISGSNHSVDMACLPFPVDWRDHRGSRVHPLPLEEVPYSLGYNQGLVQHQYIHPSMARFLAQRALPGPAHAVSLEQGPIPDRPLTSGDLSGFHRSMGRYGNERRSLRDSIHDGGQHARDRSRVGSEGQSLRTSYHGNRHGPADGYHGNWATDADKNTPGPSGYSPRGRDSVDSQENGSRSSADEICRHDGRGGNSGSKGKGQRASQRRSKSRGGKKHKQKGKNRTEED